MALLTVPVLYKVYDNMQIKLFFQELEEDTLFMQNVAFSEETKMRLVFKDDKYIVNRGTQTIYSRKYPEEIQFRGISDSKIIYNKKGKVETPSTIIFYTDAGKKYKVIFPFGAGRQYIEKD